MGFISLLRDLKIERERHELIRSMTGFGKSELEEKGVRIRVEIRSFNNRFLEITTKLPRVLVPLELEIKQMVHERINRGRVLINLSWDNAEQFGQTICLDDEVADHYYDLFQKLKQRYNLSGEVDIHTFVHLPDLFRKEEKEWDPSEVLPIVKEAVSIAIDDLIDMKEREGQIIGIDIRRRVDWVLAHLDEIEDRPRERIEDLRRRLKARLQEICADQYDQALLAQEIVLFAERSDYTEECIRLKAHAQNFKRYLDEGGAIGRRLTFLLQEMVREINTLGAKASDAVVSEKVVLIKEELEKIREQIENIE